MSDTKPEDQAAAPATDASPQQSGKPGPDYEALFERIKAAPCRVAVIDKVHEQQGRRLRTRQRLVDRELQRVYEAKTLEEVHLALEEACKNLSALNVFRRVDVLVTEEPEEDSEACGVLLDLEEKNWYGIRAATYFQGEESTCEIGAGLRNVTGNAENLTFSAEYGTENSNQYSLQFTQPRLAGLPVTLEARLQQYFRNNQKASSYTEGLRGGVLGLKSLDGRQSLQYELGWLSLTDPSRQASRAVLAQTGDYLKSCLRYCYVVDKRDTPTLPSQGWALKATSEVSGLGPDTRLRHAKQQLDAQVVLPITPGVSLLLNASLGLMLPWELSSLPSGSLPWASLNLAQPTCVADRFFLGGPSSLRGFKFKGVGPSDARRPAPAGGAGGSTPRGGEEAGAAGGPVKRDALGGDLFANFMAALTFQLPHPALQALKIHGHAFVNGGSNVQVAGTGRSFSASFQELSRSVRWSVGAGLVLPTWFGRFEANYVTVLSHQEHDRVKQGIQLGFATSAFMN